MAHVPIRGPRDKHPSGKPVRVQKKHDYHDGYANLDEPRVARLRHTKTEAIGFTAHIGGYDWEDEE